MKYPVYIKQELDDGVLMAETISSQDPKGCIYYHADYDTPSIFKSQDFINVLELGMRLGSMGYTSVEVMEN